jgi:Tfp pilus assembly protein FimV
MLLRASTCYVSGLLLLSGLTGIALANETLKQQPPLEIPKSLNDLDLSPPVDNVKSAPPKPAAKPPKSETKTADKPAAKPPVTPARDLTGLPATGSYKTKAGDTLDKLVQKFYANSPLRADVLRDALFQNNPKAFAKGNPKQLLPNSTLSLPDAIELAKRLMPAPAATTVVNADAVTVTPLGNPVQQQPQLSQVSTPAVPAGGGGAVAHSSGHNVPLQDVKRNWVRYP